MKAAIFSETREKIAPHAQHGRNGEWGTPGAVPWVRNEVLSFGGKNSADEDTVTCSSKDGCKVLCRILTNKFSISRCCSSGVQENGSLKASLPQATQAI